MLNWHWIYCHFRDEKLVRQACSQTLNAEMLIIIMIDKNIWLVVPSVYLSFCNSLRHDLLSVPKICIPAGRTEHWILASTVWTVETRGGREMRQVLFHFSLPVVLWFCFVTKYVVTFSRWSSDSLQTSFPTCRREWRKSPKTKDSGGIERESERSCGRALTSLMEHVGKENMLTFIYILTNEM